MRATAAAALVLGVLAASPGGAAPCSPSFDPLVEEVERRAYLVLYPTTPAQRAEKKALAKVLGALRRKSTSYRKDARASGSVGRALLDLYPSEVPIQDLVDGALDGLRADLGLERDDLERTSVQLPGGPLRERALLGVAEADLALADADAAADLDLEARPAALEAAALALERAFRGALPGRDGRRRRTCGDEMWVVEGGGLLWRADRVAASYQASTDRLLLSGLRARRPADESRLDLEVENVLGPGTYPLAFGSGTWFDAPFTQFDIVESGTLTITEIDAVAGTASGTFSFTARGCLFDCSAYQVTGGTFRLRNLQVF